MFFEEHASIPGIDDLAGLADMIGEMKFESEIRRDSMLRSIEKNGIPDMTGLMWFFYLLMKNCLTEDFDNPSHYETEYLRRHTAGNRYDERLQLCLTKSDPDFGSLRNDIFLERLLLDYKNGDAEAKEYIRALLIRYFPDYYKQIKKYRSMDIQTAVNDGFLPLLGMDGGQDGYEVLCKVALLIVMCQILNIEIDAEMYVLTDTMKKFYDEAKEGYLKATVHEFDPENHKRLFDEVQRFTFDDVFDTGTYQNSSKLISHIISEEFNFAKDSYIGNFYEAEVHCNLIRMLKAGIDISSLSRAELHSLMQICQILDNLLSEFEVARETVRYLVYDGYDPYPKEKVRLRLAARPGKNTTPIAKKVMEAEKVSLSDSDYIKEIERLQAKLRCAESDVIHQRELYESQKAENLILKEENKSIADMRKELAALREFAYNSAEGMTKASRLPREEMLKKLNSKSACIIGGHDKWVNKLKPLFPKWKYAAPQEQGTVPVSILDNVDHVFIFTAHICHSQSGRFIEYIRKNNIPLTYISKVNIEDNITEFYNALYADNGTP